MLHRPVIPRVTDKSFRPPLPKPQHWATIVGGRKIRNRGIKLRVARTIGAFILTLALASLLGVTASSLAVLGELKGLEVEVPWGEGMAMVLHDLVGMGPGYALIMGVGLLIAFVGAGLVARLLRPLRGVVFAVSGAVAVLVALILMRQILGVTIIAGARSTIGVLVQCSIGLIAGWLFSRLLPAREESARS